MTTTGTTTTGSSTTGPAPLDLRTTDGPALGDPVQVRSRFDARWLSGFAVAVVGPGAYQLRRLSDGAVLPAWFPAADVRPIPGDD